MADGAERVADFVRDACCQPAQRCQFELLGLLRNLRNIFEKNQGVLTDTMLQRGEAWLQHGAIWRGLELLRSQGRVVVPKLQRPDQLRAAWSQALTDQGVLV